MAVDHAELEKLFLGLADKTRLRLLGLMAHAPVSVGHLVDATGESQPKVSRHLAYLRNAGLVDTSRDGKWIYYGLSRLSDPASDAVFRCVVEELAETHEAKRQQPNTPEDAPEWLETEWTHPSEEDVPDELPVFLL